MPKKATDYSKIVIYKIQHQDKEDLLYVGSTTDFTKRKSQHKRTSTNSTYRDYNEKKYKMIRDNGGWCAFNMVQVKAFPCNNKQEAHAEEDRIMREMKARMKDRRTSKTEQQYYLDNQEHFKEKQQLYRENNKDKILKSSKEYRDKNKQVILCECGCSISKLNMLTHLKTKKHIKLISTNNND